MTQALTPLVFVRYTYLVIVVESGIVVHITQKNITHKRYQHSQNIVRVTVPYILVLIVKMYVPLNYMLKPKERLLKI